ncbi:MAG: HIT family protein [Candidatus Thermoplasmatota archaeon]
MSCLFCRIAARELPSAELYEDKQVFAFLDINPLRPGHALIVPKRHAARLADATPEDAGALLQAARTLGPVLCGLVNADDATLAIHDGPDAGQEVAHLHLHLIPRTPSDGGGPIHNLFATRPRPSPEDLNDLAMNVQTELGKLGKAATPLKTGGR